MRKYLIGVLIGILLTISSSVFADDIKSLIGMKIDGEFPVKVQGKIIDKKALAVNGTSYLPVRAISEALGMDITFDVDMGINLKMKEVNKIMTVTNEVYSTEKQKLLDAGFNIETLTSLRKNYSDMLKSYNDFLNIINEDENSPSVITTNKNIDRVKDAIEDVDRKLSIINQ